jgi:hypothetical protein
MNAERGADKHLTPSALPNLHGTWRHKKRARRKTLIEIHFMYLGKKEIYCAFKTPCIISVVYSREGR